ARPSPRGGACHGRGRTGGSTRRTPPRCGGSRGERARRRARGREGGASAASAGRLRGRATVAVHWRIRPHTEGWREAGWQPSSVLCSLERKRGGVRGARRSSEVVGRHVVGE